MKHLFNNPKFVGFLGLGAVVLLFNSLVMPFLDTDGDVVYEPVEDPLAEEDEMIFTSTREVAVEPTGPSVASGLLTWNSFPGRDPFSNAASATPAPVTHGDGAGLAAFPGEIVLPRLNALVAGPVSSLAVVNGRMVTEGMSVAGFEITGIDPAGVTLRSHSGELHLIHHKEVKQ